MQLTTLIFLIRDDEVLLAMKKRGFGEGNWNGTGGKPEGSETILQTAIRECQEEINVTPHQPQEVAILEFNFLDGSAIKTHVYITDKWEGEPAETEEMAPRWFKQNRLPFKDMWEDDKLWLPQVLRGQLVVGQFGFDDNNHMTSHQVRVVKSLVDKQ